MTEPPDPLSPRVGAVVLAAGQGTRMRSQLPKVLHPVAGQPMVLHVLDTLAAAGCAETVLVVGHGAEQVRAVVGDRARCADQPEQLGTGHAVQQAMPHLSPDVERVVVLYGDTPLLTADTVRRLLDAPADPVAGDQLGPPRSGTGAGGEPRGDQRVTASAAPGRRPGGRGGAQEAPLHQPAIPDGGPPAESGRALGQAPFPGHPAAPGVARPDGAWPVLTLLTMEVPDATGYGRVVRDGAGRVVGLVEEREATPEQRAGREVNVGAYVFDAAWLRASLPRLRRSASGEYYLTDLVALAAREGRPLAAVALADPGEGLGVNDRVQLARAEAALRGRLRERLMRAGVTMIDPATVYVDAMVTIGADTVLHPHTFLRGRTRIGAGCEIGPSTQIEDSEIGDGCRVAWSLVEGATLAADVQVGPFAHLRPGARLARGVQIGNYAEVKNSVLHENVEQHHFSYLGDAEVGRDTNVGAGTITCNFDGVNKHRTEIGERVFLGSDTLLVAPVQVGDGSATGSGAVVTRPVPPGKLAVGVPARVLRDWEPPARDDQPPPKPEKSPEMILREMAALGLDVPPELLRAGAPDAQEPPANTPTESEDA
ncbi:MAG TPA: bifunctional UDP-N-acetylglucosamine diphosphorylase/glucosamine-1-phosphate N-acetyltransferase GlmU [Chloroflexota bacterium]|nr:bifunctional UDP-N-acetylglucosamine diphosphorylase/glucosamine-1-phosphate N-acetyltransferase GlmU [Chloroflexota bacterium]